MKKIWLLAALCALVAVTGTFAKKKKKEDITQTLQVPKDPPSAVTAETRRLVFHVSPLSAKGLLSQQVRDGLKALNKTVGSAAIVKLRAFVAGSGDMRRVQTIVSESFTDRRQPLPALSVVQVGGLPLEGAQVEIESISVAKKEVNPNGLIFISGLAGSSDKPLDPVSPLAQKSLGDLQIALKATASGPEDVLRVSCFLSSLDGVGNVRTVFAKEFPQAALDFVQVSRAPARAVAECEAVARARVKIEKPLVFVNPEGLMKSPNFSQVALVGAPRVALTGTQVAFGYQDSDARLAFERLKKELAQAGSSMHAVAFSHFYPLSDSIANQVRRIRFEFYDKARPPASTMLPFEGLPSMDASFAVDVVAIAER
jgi:enamine deaminase RidA (YjgF/YER057c/UK114 family)